jgi:hypothetical protein
LKDENLRFKKKYEVKNCGRITEGEISYLPTNKNEEGKKKSHVENPTSDTM